MAVHNVVGKIGDQYEHKIPGGPLELIAGYLPSIHERISDEVRTILAKNIAKAINEFRGTYGLVSDERNLIVFGKYKKTTKILEIWKDWDKRKDLKIIYELINLKSNEELKSMRENLLKTSRQNYFNYSFVGQGNESYQISNRSRIMKFTTLNIKIKIIIFSLK